MTCDDLFSLPFTTFQNSTIYTNIPNLINRNSPTVWGPILWRYIHYSTKNFPALPTDEQKQDAICWVNTLFTKIPCTLCANNYSWYIVNSLVDEIVVDNVIFFEFMVKFHNYINYKKKQPQVSYAEANLMYP